MALSDPKLAKVALDRLRMASENLPTARENIQHLLIDVADANETIAKCEKSYQEQAQTLNTTIAHSVSSIVNRRLDELEGELKETFKDFPEDFSKIEEIYNKLFTAKRKLLSLFELSSRWGWIHLSRRQKEREAESFERVNKFAEKAKKKLEELSDKAKGEDRIKYLDQVVQYKYLIKFGSDQIDPDKIFTE